jgi:hypothetical protein
VVRAGDYAVTTDRLAVRSIRQLRLAEGGAVTAGRDVMVVGRIVGVYSPFPDA